MNPNKAYQTPSSVSSRVTAVKTAQTKQKSIRRTRLSTPSISPTDKLRAIEFSDDQCREELDAELKRIERSSPQLYKEVVRALQCIERYAISNIITATFLH